jgi:hypothetical protein
MVQVSGVTEGAQGRFGAMTPLVTKEKAALTVRDSTAIIESPLPHQNIASSLLTLESAPSFRSAWNVLRISTVNPDRKRYPYFYAKDFIRRESSS